MVCLRAYRSQRFPFTPISWETRNQNQSEDTHELTHGRREVNDHPQDVHDRRTSFTKAAKLLAAFFVVGVGRHDSRQADLYRVSVG